MRSIWCWTLALTMMLGGCKGDKEEEDRPAAGETARRDSVVRKPVYAEAEAAQILRAINEGEIALARIARERTQNDDIMRFANVMISDHRGMTELLDSLVQPVPDSANPESKRVTETTEQMVDSLWRIPGGFNNTYIEHQVREHERALLLLDTALIPSATTPELKKLLQNLRPAVVAHLQRAKQIYAARMASGLGTPQPPRPAPTPTPTPPPTTTAETPVTPPSIPRDTAPVTPPPITTTNM